MPHPAVRAYVDSLSPAQRAAVGEDVLAALEAAGYRLPNPYDAVDAGIRRTLADSGVDVPPGTEAGAFPHGSVHARAHTTGDGAVILLDPGLQPLLDRVAATLVTSQLTAGRDDQGTARYQATLPQQRQRRAEADSAYAAAVTDFVRRGPAVPGPQTTFGFFMARSAERFALGHEYGHLLAGHRHTPPGVDDQREYEADELAAMLILRGVDPAAEFRWRALAVAGPFLFLAVEQLVNRVRGRADEAHVAPERRTERLRRIFEQAGARGLLHYAEAWVSSLALREASIVALTAEVRPQQG